MGSQFPNKLTDNALPKIESYPHYMLIPDPIVNGIHGGIYTCRNGAYTNLSKRFAAIWSICQSVDDIVNIPVPSNTKNGIKIVQGQLGSNGNRLLRSRRSNDVSDIRSCRVSLLNNVASSSLKNWQNVAFINQLCFALSRFRIDNDFETFRFRSYNQISETILR